MSFQFTCPQGHLLEGDPAHAGMQSQCPMCGAMFLIPQPPHVGPDPSAAFLGVGPANPSPFGLNLGPPIDIAPAPESAVEPGYTAAAPAAPEPAAPPEEEPDPIIHILCPSGHELETPMSMVGTDAMCPHCEIQFRLLYEDSLEYREKKRKDREHREAVFSKKALNYAIIAAVLVMASLIGLMAFHAMQK